MFHARVTFSSTGGTEFQMKRIKKKTYSGRGILCRYATFSPSVRRQKERRLRFCLETKGGENMKGQKGRGNRKEKPHRLEKYFCALIHTAIVCVCVCAYVCVINARPEQSPRQVIIEVERNESPNIYIIYKITNNISNTRVQFFSPPTRVCFFFFIVEQDVDYVISSSRKEKHFSLHKFFSSFSERARHIRRNRYSFAR